MENLTLEVHRVRIYADASKAPACVESIKLLRDVKKTSHGMSGKIGGRLYGLTRGYAGGYWLASAPDGKRPCKYAVTLIGGRPAEESGLLGLPQDAPQHDQRRCV